MKLKLPAVVRAMLKQRGATMDAGLRATRAQLVKTCAEYHYQSSAAIVAFEENFGGLIIPEEPKMKKGDPVWLFGTYACITSGAHTAPRGSNKARKLVPVAY